MPNGPVVAYEGCRVLTHGHRHFEESALAPAGHPHPPQNAEADEPQLDPSRFDCRGVDGVNSPCVPQSFGRGGDILGFLPWGERRRWQRTTVASRRRRGLSDPSGRIWPC